MQNNFSRPFLRIMPTKKAAIAGLPGFERRLEPLQDTPPCSATPMP